MHVCLWCGAAVRSTASVAARCGRRSAFFAPILATYISTAAKSFDEAKAILPDLVRAVAHEWRPVMNLSELGGGFDLVIAGWSETLGPASYFFCDHHRHGVPPWTTVDLGPISLLPQTEDMKVDLAREFPNGALPDHLDPVKDGLRT
jgi:hypothetical protein